MSGLLVVRMFIILATIQIRPFRRTLLYCFGSVNWKMNKMDCLLFKPKANFYVRKNFWKLSPFKIFALVDNKNEVFGVCFFGENNPIFILRKDCTNQHYINLLGKSKFDKMSDDDYYGIFLFNDIFHLDNRVKVDTVRGVRKAKDEETVEICKAYVHQLLIQEDVKFKDVLYSKENYTKLYEYCMSEDLEGALFDLIKEGVLR